MQQAYCALCQKVGHVVRTTDILTKIFFSEVFGTMILVIFTTATNAQMVLSGAAERTSMNNYLGAGLAVTLGIFASSSVSGGHINPAFSLVAAAVCRIEWKRLPVYILGQLIGAFLGAATVYAVYYDSINHRSDFCGGSYSIQGECGTAAIFATYPQEFVSNAQGFVDQIIGTALLCGLTLAITDVRNRTVPSYLVPLLIGVLVVALNAAFEHNCQAALNPARDLGPRLFTALAGWGWNVFTHRSWSWIPIVAPMAGGVLGAFVYNLFVGFHLTEVKER